MARRLSHFFLGTSEEDQAATGGSGQPHSVMADRDPESKGSH